MATSDSSSSPLRKRNKTTKAGLRLSAELTRLSTFAKFPISCPIHPVRLAQAGFYYDGEADEVECYKCEVNHGNWNKEDNPFQVHYDKSGNCSYVQENKRKWGIEPTNENVLKESATNIDRNIPENHPMKRASGKEDKENAKGASLCSGASNFSEHDYIKQSKDSQSKTSFDTNDVLNRSGHEARNVYPSNRSSLPTTIQSNKPQRTPGNVQRSQEVPHVNLDQIGVTATRPRYPQLAILSVRQTTFNRWPKHLKQNPIILSKAGFFYEGKDDNVRCFFCGGGLRDWEPEDDPWTEHARWFPRCIFVRQCKGDNFVRSVLEAVWRTVNGGDEAAPSAVQTNIMSDPAVLSILEIGYSKEMVSQAIEIFKNRTGNCKFTAAELLPIVFDIEEGKVDLSEAEKIKDTPEETITSSYQDDTPVNDVEEKSSVIPNDPDIQLQDEEAVVRENETLKQQRTCKVCLDEEASIVFLPCGHLVTCTYCAPALHKCPVCRTHIKGTVKAIIS